MNQTNGYISELEGSTAATQAVTKRRIASRSSLRLTAILFMGLAHILFLRQYLKGLLFAAVELLFVANIPLMVSKLGDMVTLGKTDNVLASATSENTLFMLTDGIITIAVIALFITLYAVSIRSAVSAYANYEQSGRFAVRTKVLTELSERSFVAAGATPAIVLVVAFAAVPVLFSVLIAFTSFSAPYSMPTSGSIEWVGLANFNELFGSGDIWSTGLLRVVIWTVVWGLCSTLLCYIGGFILATLSNVGTIRIGKFFRSIFILPYAIPSFISVLVWRYMLNGSFGVINKMLAAVGVSEIAWLSDPVMAAVSCVIVNIWSGFPFFMLLCSGALNTIPRGSLEAAEVDGAGRLGVFFKITLPIITRQISPLLILTAAQNINNFGAIYFLTLGGPATQESISTGAGSTDILITWIYDLTINLGQYNTAAALGLVLFVVLIPFAIFFVANTKSFKEGRLYE